jgi:hypothetical protein
VRLLLIFILFMLASCAKNSAEEEFSAIDQALTLLSQDECDKAIDIMEDIGRRRNNPVYLQVLASAYACRASFNEIAFLADDLQAVDTDAANFMKSLSILSLSYESTANSAQFQDLNEALDILLNVDGNQPSQAAREAKYGPRKAGDMGIQALFLSIVQLGKFLNFYGNVNSVGAKGLGGANTDEQGADQSECFLPYTDATAIAYINALPATNACDDFSGGDNGHPEMSFAAANLETTKTRMCQGLMLVTNIIDILSNITIPQNETTDNLDEIATLSANFKTTITSADPDLAVLLDTTSQSACEALLDTPAEFSNMQMIYAMLFESGLP